MAYMSVFFVLSCGLAMTYMWLIPYITEFTSPLHKKLHVFSFNASYFTKYEVYEDDGWKEYTIHLNDHNMSCVAFVYTDGRYQWMKFLLVKNTFSFRIPVSLMTAIKLQCSKEVEFIFNKREEWLVFPLIRKDEETFVCPVQYSCTFDVSVSLQSLLSERESFNGLRQFNISKSIRSCLEGHYTL